MQSQIRVDKEDFYMLKINCKGKRTIGKANKRINIETIKIGLKMLKKRKEKKEENSTELEFLHKTAKAQHKGRGL